MNYEIIIFIFIDKNSKVTCKFILSTNYKIIDKFTLLNIDKVIYSFRYKHRQMQAHTHLQARMAAELWGPGQNGDAKPAVQEQGETAFSFIQSRLI